MIITRHDLNFDKKGKRKASDRTTFWAIDYEELKSRLNKSSKNVHMNKTKDQSEVLEKSSIEKTIDQKCKNVHMDAGKMSTCPNYKNTILLPSFILPTGEKNIFLKSDISDSNKPLKQSYEKMNNNNALLSVATQPKQPPAKTKRSRDQFTLSDDRFDSEDWKNIMKKYGIHPSWLDQRFEDFSKKYQHENLSISKWKTLACTWGKNAFQQFKKPNPTQVWDLDEDQKKRIAENYSAWKNDPKYAVWMKRVEEWGGIEECLEKGLPKFNLTN